MVLTIEEVDKQIENFLQHVPQRYMLQIDYQQEDENQLEHNLIKEEFRKIIFSEQQQECIESIKKLPGNLALEAQKLRLLRIGAELDLYNTNSVINSNCFDELSKALELGHISENLKCKFAYVSLAYYLSYATEDLTKQQALTFFTDTKNFLQQGMPFLAVDYEFLKLYYSFSILVTSFVPKGTEVHKVYNDLSLDVRFKDSQFAIRINSLISGLMPRMTWIDMQDKIAIIATYSVISESSYEKGKFCELIHLTQAIDFVTASINKNMTLFDKKAVTKDREQSNQAIQSYIAELKEQLKQIEEWGEAEIARVNVQGAVLLQQEIRNINSAIAQAKIGARSRGFQNTLKQAGAIAAGCFVGPAACGVLGVSAGMATTVASAAIGGATQTAITGGNFDDILKSAAISGVTAGVMSQVPVSSELAGSAKSIEGAKLGIINVAVSSGVSTIVYGKGKLDPAAMLGAGLAGASGIHMEGLTKDLTERAIKDTTATAIHGGELVPNLATGAIESAAGHIGKTIGEEFKSKIEADRALLSQKLVLVPQFLQERSEHGKDTKRTATGKAQAEQELLSSSKPRVSKYTSKLFPALSDPSSLDQVQILSIKSISENDLAISPKQQQQLKSNPSLLSSILSFPTDLLFGPMAYADGVPQSSNDSFASSALTRPEGIFNIFKSALDGDANAQLEMRRRFPIGAAFADAINSSYRAWNDPILGFKNNVHNRLGASWFLPGSMDDLGQVCLNSSIAISGVSVVPKIAEGYSKVQFAYQAYRTTQGFRNRLPSDRIQHEAAKSLYRQNMEKPAIQSQDPKLIKIIEELYRPDAKIGSGSTADGVRLEIANNQKVGGKWHVEKSKNTIKFLSDWLKNNPTASSSDCAGIENIITDLKDALGKKPWYSQTKPPKL